MMDAEVHAGLWGFMNGTNRLIDIEWTCLSQYVDGGPWEPFIRKLSGPNQGQDIQARPHWQRNKKEKHKRMLAYTLKHQQRHQNVNSGGKHIYSSFLYSIFSQLNVFNLGF